MSAPTSRCIMMCWRIFQRVSRTSSHLENCFMCPMTPEILQMYLAAQLLESSCILLVLAIFTSVCSSFICNFLLGILVIKILHALLVSYLNFAYLRLARSFIGYPPAVEAAELLRGVFFRCSKILFIASWMLFFVVSILAFYDFLSHEKWEWIKRNIPLAFISGSAMLSHSVFILGNHTVPVCLDRWPEKFLPGGAGIPKVWIEKGLPAFQYGELGDETERKQNSMCVVCLQEYEADHRVRRLPCRHIMHAECSAQWLKIKGVCPLRCPFNIHELVVQTVAQKRRTLKNTRSIAQPRLEPPERPLHNTHEIIVQAAQRVQDDGSADIETVQPPPESCTEAPPDNDHELIGQNLQCWQQDEPANIAIAQPPPESHADEARDDFVEIIVENVDCRQEGEVTAAESFAQPLERPSTPPLIGL